jgi:hypothetical protein
MIEASIEDRGDGAMTVFTAECTKTAARPLLPALFLAAAADYRQDTRGIAGDRS